MYPEYTIIGDKEYKIDTDFRTALKCFEVVEDTSINDEERALAIIYLLFDFIPTDDLDLFLEKAIKFLQCGENTEQQNSKEKDMDLLQDKKYIMSSFMSDYHIDLSKDKLHFWQFIDYIQGLTESSSLNRVRDLRTYDASKIEDLNEREKIINAQKQVALIKKQTILTSEQKKSAKSFYEQIQNQEVIK